MLRRDSITAANTQTTNSALLDGTQSLIHEISARLAGDESIDNPMLTFMADRAFRGSRARGTYTARDSYDAVETAVNRLLSFKAKELMAISVTDALESTLRPIVRRLPRQSDRTLEPLKWQQFSTPPTLAYIAARLLKPSPTDIVLEPSAGTGSLAI